MVNCCVLGCKSRSARKEPDITFHSANMEAINNDDMFVVIIDEEDGGPSKHINVKDTYTKISIKQEMNESTGKAGLKKRKPRESADLKMASKVCKTVEDNSATEKNSKELAVSDQERAIKSLKADVEQVIQTAEKYGQLIDIKVDNVKEETESLQDNETNTEYLQDYYTDEYSDDELLSKKKGRQDIEFHGIKEEHETEDNETDPEYIQDDISDEYSDNELLIERKNQKKFSLRASNDKNKKRTSCGASQVPHRRKMLEEREFFSLVNELRFERPKLAKDSELLIDTLADMMLATQQPQPPADVYKMLSYNKYECVKCGAYTETEPAAQRHWREKHGPRYLVCYACGADFRSTTVLYKHEKRCNAEDAEWVLKARARSLGRKARSRPFLDYDRPRKKKPKASTRRFTCDLCPNTYTSLRALQAHEHVHTGLRPYQCPHCPNAYTSRLGLNKHSVKHSGVQFICDLCGRALQTKYSLIAHLETHAQVRKFGCASCPRRFTQKAALKLHEARKHSVEPPREPCKLCDKRFHQMSLLKSHMLKEHGMSLITRKMFYQTLPKLTNTQVEKAKVVFNTDIRPEPVVSPTPSVTTPDRELESPTVPVESPTPSVITPDRELESPTVPVESPTPSVTTSDRELESPTVPVEPRIKIEQGLEPKLTKRLTGEQKLPKRLMGEQKLPKRLTGEQELPKRLTGEPKLPKRLTKEPILPKRLTGEQKLPKRLTGEPKVPKHFMGYIKKHSKADRMFVIQNGEAIFLNGENIDYFKSGEEYITP